MSDNTNYKINGVEFDDFFIKRDLFSQGGVFSFGVNTDGMLGTSNSSLTAVQTTPAEVIAYGTNYRQIAVGNNHIGAVKSDGTLWMWGGNSFGQLGANNVTRRSSPIQTAIAGNDWKQVACADNFTGGIKADGSLWLWGLNNIGQLADNTRTSRSTPVQTISAGNNWKQVACCAFNSAAVKTDGTLWVWGNNNNGQLGDNTRTHRSSPVQTSAGGTNWKQVACGTVHMAAVKTDGTLWTWGNNSNGSLGDNTIDSKSSPVQTVSGGTNWKQVACGSYYTAAIKTDGTLWTWGNNLYGQLGDETQELRRSSPVQTAAGGSSWKFVATGGQTNVAAIKTDGTLWLWGKVTGDGSEILVSSPVLQTSGYMWKTISSGGNIQEYGTTVGTMAGITEDYW